MSRAEVASDAAAVTANAATTFRLLLLGVRALLGLALSAAAALLFTIGTMGEIARLFPGLGLPSLCPTFAASNLFMRIGEVARRTGVSTTTLRVWERRYGLLRPARTEGGHRVYTAADVARVRAVLGRLEAGLTVGAAVRGLLDSEADGAPTGDADGLLAEAWAAVDALDGPRFRRSVIESIDALGVARALDLVLAPLLRQLGREWRQSPRNVAREHLASMIVRSHLLERLGDAGRGPRCLGFCPEGELHDLGLVMAGVVLAEAGWQPLVLGAETPMATARMLIDELRPEAVLVAAQRRGPALRFVERWRPPPRTTVVLGGAGFRTEDAVRLRRCSVHEGPFAELPAAVTAPLRR